MKERTDEALMVAYQMGEFQAFDELYGRYSSKVYGYLVAKVRERSLADDLFQAVFLKLHSSRGRYDSKLPFAPWLFSVCRSVMIDRIRQDGRVRELETEVTHDPALRREPIVAPYDSPDAPGESLDLAVLDCRQRRAVELRYLEESSFEEIALKLGTTQSNARQLLSRAIRLLRRKGVPT